MAEAWDSRTRDTIKRIPMLTEKAGPRDKEGWQNRLKQVRAEPFSASVNGAGTRPAHRNSPGSTAATALCAVDAVSIAQTQLHR